MAFVSARGLHCGERGWQTPLRGVLGLIRCSCTQELLETHLIFSLSLLNLDSPRYLTVSDSDSASDCSDSDAMTITSGREHGDNATASASA